MREKQSAKQSKASEDLAWVESNFGLDDAWQYKCLSCNKAYESWDGLANHAKRTHNINKSSSRLGNALSNATSEVSAEEQAAVKLIKGEPNKWMCMTCAPPKPFCFRKCEVHLEGEHEFDHATIRTWNCFKLGQAIKNDNVPKQLSLYKVIEAGLPQDVPAEQQVASDEESANHPVHELQTPATPDSKTEAVGSKLPETKAACLESAATNVSFLEDLLQKMALSCTHHQAKSSSGIEIDLPAVTIKDQPVANGKTLRTWQHPEGEKPYRVTCPLNGGKMPSTYSFDMTEFKHWLPRNTKVKKASSIYATCGNLERLFQLLDFAPGSDPKGVLCQCLTCDLITELRNLPIMDKRYSWPKAMMDALDHYLKFQAMLCNRARPRLTETKLTLQQLNEEVVQGLKGEDQDQRMKQCAAKKRKDTNQMYKQWPDTLAIKAAVSQAMVDLAYVVERYEGTPVELALMNKLIIGIIHYNEFAGRSGEWAKLSAVHVHVQFRDGKHVLVCQDHKTASVYGDVGKYLSPGTKRAMEVYDSAFQGQYARETDMFFVPCNGDHVSISYYLRKFGEDNFPELPPPNSNILRKQFTSVTDRHAKQNKCFQMMKAYDKHGEATMRRTYICESAEQDAEYGQYIFKEVYGDPVPWPTAEEIKTLTRKLFGNDDEQEPEDDEYEECEDESVDEDICDDDSQECQNVAALEGTASDVEGAGESVWDELDANADSNDESQHLDKYSLATLMLQKTMAPYTEYDSIETAAAKAEHVAASLAAVKIAAQANPTSAHGVGEALLDLSPQARLHFNWPQISEVVSKPISPKLGCATNQVATAAHSSEPHVPAVAKSEFAGRTKGRGRAKGVSKGKTPEQRTRYAIYGLPDTGLGTSRNLVPDEAHEWMDDQLKAWQIETGAQPWERPLPNEWYWDKRCECIDANVGVTTSHSWDVVRSWLKKVAKSKESAQDVD